MSSKTNTDEKDDVMTHLRKGNVTTATKFLLKNILEMKESEPVIYFKYSATYNPTQTGRNQDFRKK